MRRAGTLALIVCVAAALAAPAGASALACGDSLNKDTTLTADLDCSAYAGDALSIVHKGVTLDLNGFTLTGPASTYHGIDSTGGYDNLTIKDGTIEGFYHAINLAGTKDSSISKLRIELGGTNQDYGVYVGDAPRLRLSKITIHNADYGFYLYSDRNVKLVDSTVSGGDPSDFYSGVYVGASDGRISDVHVKGADFGLYLAGTTSGWEVTDSSANRGGYAGFYIANENQTSPGTISHNTANNNETYGFWAAERTHGHGNRAKGNGTKNCRRVNCV